MCRGRRYGQTVKDELGSTRDAVDDLFGGYF